jgi:hypothetical protein
MNLLVKCLPQRFGCIVAEQPQENQDNAVYILLSQGQAPVRVHIYQENSFNNY